jgi:hypothetical protein
MFTEQELRVIDLYNEQCFDETSESEALRLMIHDLHERLAVIEADRDQWLEQQTRSRVQRIWHNVRLFFR